MEQEEILEPIKYYQDSLKDQHNQRVSKFFDDLVTKSKINIEENKKVVKKINDLQFKLDNLNKEIKKKKAFRTLLIIGTILSALGAIFSIAIYTNYDAEIDPKPSLPIIIFIVCMILFIAFIIINKKVIKPKINELNGSIDEFTSKINELKRKGYQQMAPLVDLFEYGQAAYLLDESIDLITMDKNFDIKKFLYLKHKYGFKDNTNKDSSTLFVQSGAILGNPFLIIKSLEHYMGSKTYTGQRTITWTETIHTEKGTTTVTKSEVLTASVTEPYPYYYTNTKLIYGCDAAPNLSFTREPQIRISDSDNKIEQFIKSEERKLDRRTTKSTGNGGTFTRLSNMEFEALFHAYDRNNETEFRLLFTPLAQKNLINVIRSKTPFGDDFKFKKYKCINTIKSKHSQNFNYNLDPKEFNHYNYESIRNMFLTYNETYFKYLYFDLVPLISIPLYQQYKSKETIYEQDLLDNLSNYTSYEHEAIANQFNENYFKPDSGVTSQILKSSILSKDYEEDSVNITSYSYSVEHKYTYISVFGGDGRYHDVRVDFDQFHPVSKNTIIKIGSYSDNDQEIKHRGGEYNLDTIIYQRGLYSYLQDLSRDNLYKIKQLFKKEK